MIQMAILNRAVEINNTAVIRTRMRDTDTAETRILSHCNLVWSFCLPITFVLFHLSSLTRPRYEIVSQLYPQNIIYWKNTCIVLTNTIILPIQYFYTMENPGMAKTTDVLTM
jgi:hypothetical protein